MVPNSLGYGKRGPKQDDPPAECGNLYSSRSMNSSVLGDILQDTADSESLRQQETWEAKIWCLEARPLERDSFRGKARHPLSTPYFRKSIHGAHWVRRAAGSLHPLCQCTSSPNLIRREVKMKTMKIPLCLGLWTTARDCLSIYLLIGWR